MSTGVQISKFQLAALIMGFVFGSSAIMNPVTAVSQDAWLSYLIGWAAGFVLLGIYIAISLRHPGKTLIEILIVSFGQYLGRIIALYYIWYFIHLAALVLRVYGEFFVTAVYPETPIIFLLICFTIVIIYFIKSGLEVMGRVSELFVPIILIQVILLSLLLLPSYDTNNFFPVMENGFKPVFDAAVAVLSFPFGEVVIFLMVFPFLNKQRELLKTGFLSLLIIGLVLLITSVRDLLVLGADIYSRYSFPPEISARLVHAVGLHPIIDINLLFGGLVKMGVCLYAAVMGITQLFNLKNYQPFVLPLASITVGLSIWLYDNFLGMLPFVYIYIYYALLPLQFTIPVIILIISLLRRNQ